MRKTAFWISIILFALLFFVPLVTALSKANTEDLISMFSDPYYLQVIRFTFKQALTSTILSLVVGLPGAWIISHYNFRIKKTIKAVYYIPYVLPSILVVLGFVIFYGNSGILNSILGTDIKILYSYKAVLLAHVFFNFPVVINIVGNKWASLDKNYEDEARVSGADDLLILKRIILPRLLSSILSACVIVFLFCFTSFAIILVLGGGPKLTTAEVEIYKLSRITFDIGKASSFALISLFTAALTLIAYNLLNSFQDVEETSERSLLQLKNAKLSVKVFSYFYLVLTLLFLVLPLLGIIIRAFDTSSFKGFNPIAIVNTLLIGLVSSLLTVTISLSVCSVLKSKKNKVLETVLMAPMAASSIFLGLGYFMCSKYLKAIPDFVLIVLCHSILNTPYAIKSILPVYRSLPEEQLDAAKLDGSGDFEILKSIEIPYLKSTLSSTFMLVFALSCGELNSTLMISTGNFLTIPVQIQRMIAAYNFKGACALGSVLILISASVFVISQTVDF